MMNKFCELFILVSLILMIPFFPIFALFGCFINGNFSFNGFWNEICGLFGEITYSFDLLME